MHLNVISFGVLLCGYDECVGKEVFAVRIILEISMYRYEMSDAL
jgi:hypothetical protein